MKEQIIYQWNKVVAYFKLAKHKVVGLFTNEVKDELANKSVQQPPTKVMYVKLCAIYEGDLKMQTEQFISVFLLQLQDIDGHEYICPIYAEPNHREAIKISLNQCKPVHMLFDHHNNGGVSIKDDVEVKQDGNNNVVNITSVNKLHS